MHMPDFDEALLLPGIFNGRAGIRKSVLNQESIA